MFWAKCGMLAILSAFTVRNCNCDGLISLVHFDRCQWVIDLTSTKEPDVVLGTYFNEKGLFDVKDKLEGSELTNFLRPVKKGDSEGYYVFPYFIIVRATCDSGFYDDGYYRLIMNGDYPTISLRYWPTTSRMPIRRMLKVTATGALISIQPDEQHLKVPINPNAPICYIDMCYPGFVVPLVFLHTPIFDVVVEAVGEFSKSKTRIHVSPFHSRKGNDPADIVLSGSSEKKIVPSADLFFPTDRITHLEDSGLTEEVITALADDDHFPLDKEDFIEPQYTYGTAPVVFFSGFYQPDLIIMADPDLHDIRLIRWGRNPLRGNSSDENATIFDHGLSCNLPADNVYYGDDEYPIPYYTRGDGSMNMDWLATYYRKRHQPMEYYKFPAPNAIYEVISMQDRILLVTNSGMVVLYGDTNGTMAVDSALKATGSEKLRKCFKLVRISKFAFQETDLIVAVTYNYTELRSYMKENAPLTTTEDIDQEIYMGKLSQEGRPIEWLRLGDTPGMDSGLPKTVDEHGSQTRSICYLAADVHFKLDTDITIVHCNVIDASPVSGLSDTIQVLVEMEIIHEPTLVAARSNQKEELKLLEREAYVTFYIIAQYSPLNIFSEQIWEIISVLPRRPCKESHKQSVQTLEYYDTYTYFNHEPLTIPNGASGDIDVKNFKKNCHYRLRDDMKDDLHLKRMTYTRQNDGHLYIYGNNLIHSTDKGAAFSYLPDFPSDEDLIAIEEATETFIDASMDDLEEKYLKAVETVRSHVVKVMAFSDGAYYAFLTSKRHLYLGSTGTLKLMRIRPSPGYSMIRTVLSAKPGLHDGRPFSILFDSDNRLFELVAIVNSDKRVVDISKREIQWTIMAENNNFVKKLQDNVEKVLEGTSDAKKEFEKDVFIKGNKKYKTYCPYGDPVIQQNFTTVLSLLQHIAIREPLQHKHLGVATTFKSLMAFQASAYSLLHDAYLNPKQERFSHIKPDPLQSWVTQGRQAAQTGFFKYFVGDPHKYGIIVDPSSFKRLQSKGEGFEREMPDQLVLDYNQVVKFDISFAVTTSTATDRTDYRTQKLSELQLTVDNGNGTIVSIETERTIRANESLTTFSIYVFVNKETAKLPQRLPGIDPTVVPISFHFIRGFQNCLPKDGGAYIGDSLHTSVYVGCPASSELQLNWNSTLRSMRFRNPKVWMGKAGECHEGEPVCFYVKLPLVLDFDVFDSAKQRYVPYKGKYTLRVIGGGSTKDTIHKYSEDDQNRYNIPGVSDISLIWSEWDQRENQKVQVKRDFEHLNTEEVVLSSGESAIKWTCHALSPCAHVLPTWSVQSVYYFNIKISNRGVDFETLCLHEREFVIQLYGFHPSPEVQLTISLVFCVLIMLTLYFLYLCCRNNRRVWRANKLKVYGWMQIILDTIPTSKTYSDLSHELSDQIRKDEIILSLQGHLDIPEGLPETKALEHTVKRREPGISRSSEVTIASSSSSSTESKDDLKVESGTLPHVHTRHSPATWTDMIYDQVITKRVHAIIERNNKMKDVILRKVEMTDQMKSMEDPSYKPTED